MAQCPLSFIIYEHASYVNYITRRQFFLIWRLSLSVQQLCGNDSSHTVLLFKIIIKDFNFFSVYLELQS